VLEQDENHIVILLTYEFDDTTYEFTVANTLLWSYNELSNEINRTAYFFSTEITAENMYVQYDNIITSIIIIQEFMIRK